MEGVHRFKKQWFRISDKQFLELSAKWIILKKFYDLIYYYFINKILYFVLFSNINGGWLIFSYKVGGWGSECGKLWNWFFLIKCIECLVVWLRRKC